MELLLGKMGKTPSNVGFLAAMSTMAALSVGGAFPV